MKRHLDNLRSACGWRRWRDVTESSLLGFLAAKRVERSPATANAYLRSAKGFAKWYSVRIEASNPFRSIRAFNEEVDRRRARRILTDEEFAKLLAAAEAAPRRYNCRIRGRDRAVLYRLAAYTGLRASELASLTPASFDLQSTPPTVTIEAANAKARRRESLPLHDHVASFLREWLSGRNASAKLWPGLWAKHKQQVRWLARDAKRAGIEGPVSFHDFRRRFVTRLIRSGIDVDLVRRLARHRDVKTTLDYYAESDLPELGEAVNRMPIG